MSVAGDLKKITEEIEVSYGERVAFLTDLFKESDMTLKNFRRQHEKMATDLWDFLASTRGDREKIVKALRSQNKKELVEMAEKLAWLLKESRTAIKTEVKKTLSDFAAEHEERSKELGEQLAAFKRGLRKDVKEMRAAVISDLKEAKKNWQNLAKIMSAKRSGKKVPITAVPKEAEVSKKIEEEAEEAFGEGELKVKALSLIEENPEGITLPELGKKLKTPYIRLARPISELVKEGKVRKEDSQYFAV